MEAPSGCTIAQKGSQGQPRPPSCSNHKVRRQGSAELRREPRALSRLAARQRRQQPEPELVAATTTERCGEGEQGPDETLRLKTGGGRGTRLTTAPREWKGPSPLAAAHTSSPRGGSARPGCRTVPSRAVEPPRRGAREPRAHPGGPGSPGAGAGAPGRPGSRLDPPGASPLCGHDIPMGTVARNAPLCRTQTLQTPSFPRRPRPPASPSAAEGPRRTQ
nr:translation initiation factor IF-2-like [Pan paniscus]